MYTLLATLVLAAALLAVIHASPLRTQVDVVVVDDYDYDYIAVEDVDYYLQSEPTMLQRMANALAALTN